MYCIYTFIVKACQNLSRQIQDDGSHSPKCACAGLCCFCAFFANVTRMLCLILGHHSRQRAGVTADLDSFVERWYAVVIGSLGSVAFFDTWLRMLPSRMMDAAWLMLRCCSSHNASFVLDDLRRLTGLHQRCWCISDPLCTGAAGVPDLVSGQRKDRKDLETQDPTTCSKKRNREDWRSGSKMKQALLTSLIRFDTGCWRMKWHEDWGQKVLTTTTTTSIMVRTSKVQPRHLQLPSIAQKLIYSSDNTGLDALFDGPMT